MDRYAFDVADSKYARSIDWKGPRDRRARSTFPSFVYGTSDDTKNCVVNGGNHSRILDAHALDGANGAQETHERNVLSSIERFVQANE